MMRRDVQHDRPCAADRSVSSFVASVERPRLKAESPDLDSQSDREASCSPHMTIATLMRQLCSA